MIPFTCFVALNSGCSVLTYRLLLFRQRPACVQRASLHDEPADDAVERGPVVHARLRQPEEVTHVFGREIRKELDRDWSGAGVEHGADVRELGGVFRRERIRLRRRGVPDRYRLDDDALGWNTLRRCGHFRDLLHHVHAFSHPAKHRVLAIERGLIGDADEELGASAFRSVRLEHSGNCSRVTRSELNSGARTPSPPVP